MNAPPIPPLSARHRIAPDACLRCGGATDGTLRAAIWEEEEKGRLGARPAVLCTPCHAAFFGGAFGRIEVAHWYHAAKNYVPREWIRRIDRDRLLETACLSCGVLLVLPPVDATTCPQCGSVNRIRTRGGARITASLEKV